MTSQGIPRGPLSTGETREPASQAGPALTLVPTSRWGKTLVGRVSLCRHEHATGGGLGGVRRRLRVSARVQHPSPGAATKGHRSGTTETTCGKGSCACWAAGGWGRGVSCASGSWEPRRRAAANQSGIARRQLLARELRQGLSSRSKRERAGLRGPRQRKWERRPLRRSRHDDDNLHDGDHDHVDDNDVQHNNYSDDDEFWISRDSASRERWTAVEFFQRARIFRRVNPAGNQASASEATCRAGERRACGASVIGAEQTRRAPIHGLSRLGNRPHRLGHACDRARLAQGIVVAGSVRSRLAQPASTAGDTCQRWSLGLYPRTTAAPAAITMTSQGTPQAAFNVRSATSICGATMTIGDAGLAAAAMRELAGADRWLDPTAVPSGYETKRITLGICSASRAGRP
jgi:hypothetical protein